MMKIFQVILTALLIVVSFQTTALANNTITAKNILQLCTTPNMNWINFCNGFFHAVHDQQSSLGKLCAPNGTTRTNLVEIYERDAAAIIASTPSAGENPAVDLAGEIFRNQFPCK
tara:strand:- start:933 stop:1277 length:345 start_codon:yes stop_codon:yes gene_type:complete